MLILVSYFHPSYYKIYVYEEKSREKIKCLGNVMVPVAVYYFLADIITNM